VLTSEAQLKLVSKAWGKQSGYVFFPWIDGDAEDKAQRIRGYNEGPAFKWPKQRDEIIAHIEKHRNDDVYWCPSIFEKPHRRLELAMDEHALWADLDEVDPRGIDEHYKPTIAWETSPGRYQALWIITGGDVQGASWPGNENQKLTYFLGADHSGWDTTQLLRLPGARNHKYEYRIEKDGKPVRGKLLWHNGPRYLPDHFEDLPEVRGAAEASLGQDILEDQISTIDRLEVWGRVRLKCSKEVRELVAARSTGGQDRSDKLWQIERDLADAGCTVTEIVAITRETVWNKFSGRNDELKRLVTEAAKAIAERSEETEKQLEKDREEKARPVNLFAMVKDAEPPQWLVKGILTKASCGFFAGEPKSYKSWCALDLALSVATGAPFLQAFDVVDPGPVLYIQEEDPLPTLKDRLGKIAPSKTQDRVTIGDIGEDGVASLVWSPAEENDEVPPVAAIVREQFTISDPGWQAWLDEVLEEGYDGDKYRLLIVDTLGTTAGEVDENRAQEMNLKVLTPLRQMAEKHGCSVQVVHHLRKVRDGDSSRAGQRMLGSVALHAWSESSLYFSHGRLGAMLVETESKSAISTRFEIRNLRKRNAAGALTWEPEVIISSEDDDRERARDKPKNGARKERASTSSGSSPRVGQGTRRKIARYLDLDEESTQAEVRDAWEKRGYTWGDWSPIGGVAHRSGGGSGAEDGGDEVAPRGRRAEANPAALQALKKLTARQPRAYSTHEVKDEMAKILGTKPTQTLYLRAYQQLKKLWDQDRIDRLEKDWILPEVTSDDLVDAEVEELIG
jgi:hypothetical protein